MKNAAPAKDTKKVKTAKKATAETVTATVATDESSTIAELKAMLEAQKREIEALKTSQPIQTVQVSASTEKVHFLWQAEVADDNIMEFGPNGMYGRITGKTGSFYVPKDDMSRIIDSKTRYFLDQRWLIIVSGLTDEEREAYGVNYNEGELLDKKAFAKMIDLGEELVEIYPKLCAGNREIVAKRLYEAWNNGDKRITRTLIFKLNVLSKELGSEKGDFYTLLNEMNTAEIQQ